MLRVPGALVSGAVGEAGAAAVEADDGERVEGGGVADGGRVAEQTEALSVEIQAVEGNLGTGKKDKGQGGATLKRSTHAGR